MDKVSKLLSRVNDNISKLNISGAPRLLLLTFASIFVAAGLLYIFGLLLELYFTAKVNYKAVNDFISAYFSVASVATFGVIGKALIDSDGDGNPDAWLPPEKEKEEKDE